MDTFEINNLLKDFKNFHGAVCRDQLPKITRKPVGIIVNTDPCSLPGEHWVAIFLDKNGKGEYFDPFGLPPLHSNFIDFLNTNCLNGWYYNNITLQSISASTCGHYCVLYIASKLKDLKTFYSLFTTESRVNDMLVKSYINNNV